MWFILLLLHCEGPVLDVSLYSWVIPSATNHTFSIKNRVFWISGQLVLGSVSNQSLAIGCECNVGGSDTVALFISDDVNTAILIYANTVCGRAFNDRAMRMCNYRGKLQRDLYPH